MSDRTEIEKKLEKIHQGFTDTVAGLTVKDLEVNILMYAKHSDDTQEFLKKNEAIKSAQEQLKELKGPSLDMLKALKLKMSYLHLLIKEKTEGKNEEEES